MTNRVTELLNIKYPIFLGAMGAISLPPLVAAVSNAGGLGILATAGMSTDWVREKIAETKELTDKPFGVNLALVNKNIDEIIDVLIEEDIKVVTTGAGNPIPYIERFKENNIIFIPVVPSARVAKKMEDNGADAVVVEGTEAGGHVGEATTFTLVRQAADKVSIPIIAAGGIADGYGVAAAYALGAEGVQVGTAFVVAKECPIAPEYKQAILNATDTSTTVVGRSKGAPIRVEKNNKLKELYELEMKEATTNDEMEQAILEGLKAAAGKGDVENGTVTYGQIAGIITKEKPAKEIIESMFQEADEVISKLQK